MDDSKFYRMVREEKRRWLKSRGVAGGSLTEFKAHLTKLIQTDSEWRDASAEDFADRLFDKAGRIRRLKPQPEIDDTTQVRIDHVTVRDLIEHARIVSRQAKTKAQRAKADRLMDAADVAKERAGGNLDIKVRDIRDQVWPARETRQ